MGTPGLSWGPFHYAGVKSDCLALQCPAIGCLHSIFNAVTLPGACLDSCIVLLHLSLPGCLVQTNMQDNQYRTWKLDCHGDPGLSWGPFVSLHWGEISCLVLCIIFLLLCCGLLLLLLSLFSCLMQTNMQDKQCRTRKLDCHGDPGIVMGTFSLHWGEISLPLSPPMPLLQP